MPRRFLLLSALAGVLTTCASAADAATFTVTSTANAGAGTLRQAITDANAAAGPDTVAITATGTVTLATALPVLADELTIEGPGARQLTIARDSMAAEFRVLESAVGSTVSISGMTVTGGRWSSGNYAGAGVLNRGTMTLTEVAVTGNLAINFPGAGVFSVGPSIIVRRSLIANNTATGGFAAGGGIGVERWEAPFDPVYALIEDSTITGNSATFGIGGLYVGALSTIDLRGSTVTGNSAPDYGANVGHFNFQGVGLRSRSSIIANPLGGGANCGVGPKSSLGFNLTDTADTCALTQPTDLVGVDPQLGALSDNGGPTDTRALPRTSPALDAGAPGTATDQRGEPRPSDALDVANAAGGDGSDIGAFELDVATAAPVVSEIDGDTGVADDDGVTADDTVLVRGTAEDGATVRVTENGLLAGTVVAGPTGRWTLDLTGRTLGDGTHVLAASATDAMGNVSPASDPFALVVDTTAPGLTLRAAASPGPLAARFGLLASEPVFGLAPAALDLAGSTAPGPLAAALTDEAGRWAIDVTGATGAGDVRLGLPPAAVTDRAGNPSAAVSAAAAVTAAPPAATPSTVTVTTLVPAPAPPTPGPPTAGPSAPRSARLPTSVTSVLTLPSTRRCLTGLRVGVRSRTGVARVEIAVAGRTTAHRTAASLGTAVVVRGIPRRGSFKVRVRVRRTDGRTLTAQRTYRACAPGAR